MARGKLAAISVATASVLGTVLVRRRRRMHQTRVDLYFGDGSMLSLADDAPETAEKTGRFGLLNMAQRAEQIGAILDVKRWPGGGTHVALEWRPR